MGLGLNIIAQTKATRKIQEKYEENTSLYFYQSTLRAINKDNNEDLDKLIRGVEKITFVNLKADSASENLLDNGEFESFVSDLKAEGYTEMAAMNSPESSFAWYAVEDEGPESFVAIMADNTSLSIIDLIGKVDISLIYSLEAADMEVLGGILEDYGIGK